MRLFCDLGKTAFRPEYKGGLKCEMRDKDKRPVKSTSFPFGGGVPKSEWVTLPSDATIRLRASPFGIQVRQNGQTPGKKFAGIRVLRESGGPLDFRAAGIRNLLGLADFLPAFYLLGALIAMVSPRGQRLGDVAAGTLVIRERVLRLPVELDKEMERLASNDFVFTAEQLAACASGDRHVLRSFLQRYGEMEAHSRHQLATRLAQALSQRMAYQPSAPITDGCRAEAFLASLYRDLEKWVRHGR